MITRYTILALVAFWGLFLADGFAQAPKMVFAHVSDHHLDDAANILNQIQVFKDILGHAQTQNATFCVYTGDITQEADPAECKAYAQAFDESAIPVYPVIGNHDINRPYTVYVPGQPPLPPNVDWNDLATIGVTNESQLHTRVNYQLYIEPRIMYDFQRLQNGVKCLFVVGDSQVDNQLKADQLNNLPAFQGLNPKTFENHVIDRLTAAESQGFNFVFVLNHMPYDGTGYTPSAAMSTAVAGLKDFVFLNGHTHGFNATRKESNKIARLTAPATGPSRGYALVKLFADYLLYEEWTSSHINTQGVRSWEIKESRKIDINRIGSSTVVVRTPPNAEVLANGAGLVNAQIIFRDQPSPIEDNPLTVEAGKPITFDASPSTPGSGTISSVIWDFGDGTKITKTGTNPAADTIPVENTYTIPGTHRLVARVINSVGSSESARADILVVEPAMNRIPLQLLDVQPGDNGTQQVRLRIPENQSGATYIVKPSKDLVRWNDGPLYFTGTGVGAYLDVVITIPAGISAQFFLASKKVIL